METFLIIGAIGLVLLIVSVLLDGIFDFLSSIDTGNGMFSLTSLSAGIASLGIGGYVGLSQGSSLAVAIGLGIACALVFMVISAVLTRFLARSVETLAPNSMSLIGKRGVVITDIKGNEGFGEIRINHSGHLVKMYATSVKNISAGKKVTVIKSLSSTSVEVSPVELELSK